MAFGDKKKQDAIRKSRENKQDITTDSTKKSTAAKKTVKAADNKGTISSRKITSSYTLKPENKAKLDRLAREDGFDSTSLYLDRLIEREM